MKKANLYLKNAKTFKKVRIINSYYKITSCSKITFKKEDYTGFIIYTPIKEIFIKDRKDKLTLNHELTHAFFNEIYLITNFNFIKRIRSNEFLIDLISRFITLF